MAKLIILIATSILAWMGVTNFLVDQFINKSNPEILQVLVVLVILAYTVLIIKFIAVQILSNL